MDLIDCPLFSEIPFLRTSVTLIVLFQSFVRRWDQMSVYMFIKFVSLCNDLRNNLLSNHADDT